MIDIKSLAMIPHTATRLSGQGFFRGARRAAFSASSSSSAPFRVLGLQQIAIGALDKGPLAQLWTGLLGIPKVGTYKSLNENVDEDILVTGHGPYAVEIDLMQPIDPSVPPKVHVPTLNHVGLWVDDLEAAVTHLTTEGVRFAPGGIRAGASGHDVAFIHPKTLTKKRYNYPKILVWDKIQPWQLLEPMPN